jgi:hypothetical protein
VRNAGSYQVQVSLDGGVTWLESVISRKAFRIVLANLMPTKTYTVRARAIGGSAGSSAWVVSGSIVCTRQMVGAVALRRPRWRFPVFRPAES